MSYFATPNPSILNTQKRPYFGSFDNYSFLHDSGLIVHLVKVVGSLCCPYHFDIGNINNGVIGWKAIQVFMFNLVEQNSIRKLMVLQSKIKPWHIY